MKYLLICLRGYFCLWQSHNTSLSEVKAQYFSRQLTAILLFTGQDRTINMKSPIYI